MPRWPVAALLLLVLVSTAAAFVPSPAAARIDRRPAQLHQRLPTRSSTASTTSMSSSVGNWFSGGKPDPQALVRQGMDAFRQGMVQESIDMFDQALALDRRIEPYLWQRCVRETMPHPHRNLY